MLQIAREYPGLPDVLAMSLSNILFFYNGLRYELIERTKPKG